MIGGIYDQVTPEIVVPHVVIINYLEYNKKL